MPAFKYWFLLWTLLGCFGDALSQSPLLNLHDPVWKTDTPAEFKIRITTSKGVFVLEIHTAWGPIGANRLYHLARLGFFDNSRFYRVREGSFVQFGIPGRPEVAKFWQREAMPDDPRIQSNRRGCIAYAMTGPDTRTTQLFINLQDNTQLDPQGFAPIGLVTQGMEVLDSLFSGYGESSGGGMRGGKQSRLFEEGNTYLDNEFPKLDRLIKAEVIK